MPADFPTSASLQEPADRWRERVRAAWRRLRRFLRVLFLAALWALLAMLPWVLAAGTVLLWLAGTLRAAWAVEAVYGPGIPHPAALWALQGATVVACLALPVQRLAARKWNAVWGSLAVSGAGGLLFAWALPRLLVRAPLETLLFPTALGMALHVFITVRLRWRLGSVTSPTGETN